MEYVFGVIIALAVLALVLFPGFRKKLKVLLGGILDVFIEDQAKTPEGAAAVFNQAIDEVQEKYNQASSTLNKLSGELNHAKTAVERLSTKIKQVEASCESLVKAGRMADAQVYAEKRSELMTELQYEQSRVTKLTPMVVEATQIHTNYGNNLNELKRKKKETIAKIKMNTQMKDLYGDLDELRKDSATDKMLSAVLDGSTELEKEADGARIVHENKASTKIARAEQNAAKLQNDAYLENLKKKYNGGK